MEQNLPPLPPVIFENGLYYELRGEQYYPRRSRTPQRTSCWKPSSARWQMHKA